MALAALLLLLFGACACLGQEVSSPDDFFAALYSAIREQAVGETVIELQDDITLSPAAASSYPLPFVVPGNHSLKLTTADGALKDLNFGKIESLIYLKAGSSLFVDTLNVSGSADPYLGQWPEDVDSPTVIQSLPLWPTLGADPGAKATVSNSLIYLHPLEICTPEIGEVQYEALRQLARASGSNRSEIDFSGTVAHMVDWAAPMPVLSATTKVAIGTIYLAAENTTIYCRMPDGPASEGAPLPGPSGNGVGSSSSEGGGSAAAGSAAASASGQSVPAWAWALLGTAATLAMAAAAAVLLWRRARKRLRQRQREQLTPLNVHVLGGEGHSSSPKERSLSLKGAPSGSLPSGGGGSGLEQRDGRVRPEGPWKSRVGFIEGLQLGTLIGRGGYARVYKGRWKGTAVAVKVVETCVGPHQQYDLRNEPLLSLSLTHPNVLQGYKMCVVRLLTDAGQHPASAGTPRPSSPAGSAGLARSASLAHSGGTRGSGSGGRVVPHLTDPSSMVEVMPSDAVLEPGMYEMWLVSELADKGNLLDAMKAGLLAEDTPSGRDMPAILLCLLDIARGLEYLHSCSIVHGDLKPQNVMLKTAAADRRGYVCKLGDFGLSRMLQETETHVNTGSYGTVTHAAPELLSEGRLTKSSDVFAFGMLLWELVTGQRLFRDMHHMQIIVQVTQRGYRPPIPSGFPPSLAALAERCWAQDAKDRPAAGELVTELIKACYTLESTEQHSRE